MNAADTMLVDVAIMLDGEKYPRALIDLILDGAGPADRFAGAVLLGAHFRDADLLEATLTCIAGRAFEAVEGFRIDEAHWHDTTECSFCAGYYADLLADAVRVLRVLLGDGACAALDALFDVDGEAAA